MESYLELFVSETEEFTRQLNRELLALESDPRRTPSILEVFRIFHTIKGMAQTMGYDDLGTVCHRVEDILGPAKKSGATSSRLVGFLFTVADFLAAYVRALKDRAPLPPAAEIIGRLDRLERGEDVAATDARADGARIAEIRVKMEKLDKLFNFTNELLITRSRLVRLSQEIGHAEMIQTSENASRLITTLQDEVMRLRMLPLSAVFEFFPRWVRDESRRQGKEVALVITGAETEVDRSIIDILKEPIMHLVRNALDHGIAAKGTITLRALRERERIRITVADDGRGIDCEAVKRLAVERGLLNAAEVATLSREGVYRILMNPSFSTRSEVSRTSGRGIGLDIVNATITRLGGRLEIDSEKGHGSAFTMDLPLSLAIQRTIVFALDGQRFALPLNFVQETFYLTENSLRTVYHRELYPLRDEILPLVRLADRLGCTSKSPRKSVIVVEEHECRRGFVVDDIVAEDEIVVKKVDPLLPETMYSGCSIYADGRPILILDPRGFE